MPLIDGKVESTTVYADILPVIDDIISDHNNSIIIMADCRDSINYQVLTYLNTKRFRNCTVYDFSRSHHERYSFPCKRFRDAASARKAFQNKKAVDTLLGC